jgi:DnaK suppressor protein
MLTNKELEEFKSMLLEKRQKILANVKKAKNEIGLMRNQSPTDEGDHAVLTNESAIDNTLIEKQLKELEEIELALDKISKGEYGICEMCEEPIGADRLRVKPFARFCITCREINEKEKASETN